MSGCDEVEIYPDLHPLQDDARTPMMPARDRLATLMYKAV